MFGIGSTELVIILIVALVVIGPQKLPELMRSLGKGIAEFRQMGNDVKNTLDREVENAEQQKRKKEAEKELFPEDKKGEKTETAEADVKSETKSEEKTA
ncbi:MAG: Sec-independent protein translocase protein TatB [Desulfovibrio sp.]